MNIEADALRYDEVKQTSVFTGRVVMTKGTIVLRGARLDVRQDAEGYQFGTVTAEPGKRAFFRRSATPGQAPRSTSKARPKSSNTTAGPTVRFIPNAELRRYLGATVSDEMTGAVIVYDNGTDVFTVDGSVRPRLGPGRRRAGACRAVAAQERASAPAAPAASPAPLRPSTLGGERK
jgi:lipopolysaccharide export system protein LptA